MSPEPRFTRRRFVRSAALTAPVVAGTFALSSCRPASGSCWRPDAFPEIAPGLIDAGAGSTGLLFSQVGYESGHPVRVVVRLPAGRRLPDGAVCRMVPENTGGMYEAPCDFWGEIWGSNWWVAEFGIPGEGGRWDLEVREKEIVLMRDGGLRIGKDLLWNETALLASVDMLERRTHFTKVGAGWQDAGTLWVESPAQSATVIALTELLERAPDRLDDDFIKRIYAQICVGCDYLLMTQRKAAELGFPAGSMSHDLLGHERDILPGDAAKAVVALLRAVRFLPSGFDLQRGRYREAAWQAAAWLRQGARPMGDYSYSRFQRGLPEKTPIPADEWQTRDLIFLCWGALEMARAGDPDAREACTGYARAILSRQISEVASEGGFFGQFREFDSLPHSEKAWAHGIIENKFGADMGGLYPNYLMPMIEMLKLWPDHVDAPSWRQALEQFTYGYLIPACGKNPFHLIPLGIFGEEGPIWFCGTFHGTNSVYGYTAALAFELAGLLGEPLLLDIAYGNLQWLAGLNAGITREGLAEGSVVYSADVPEGMALPASMICGVGKRSAGSWFATRGVICNGFTTGRQFVYDVAPLKANDRPASFTDEDWIPHSAGWLTALIRMRSAV
jgi:hypothetical protein